MRGHGPFLFAQVTAGLGVDVVAAHILEAWRRRLTPLVM